MSEPYTVHAIEAIWGNYDEITKTQTYSTRCNCGWMTTTTEQSALHAAATEHVNLAAHSQREAIRAACA